MRALPQTIWRNFTRDEMSCNHCGEYFHWPEFMDRLQRARDIVGRPFNILSAHRCAIHNAHVGGAPLSQHLKLAVDISLAGHDRHFLAKAFKDAGFTGFGYYQTFLHADLGRKRFWYNGNFSEQAWQI